MAAALHSSQPQPVRRSATLPPRLFAQARANSHSASEETENEIFYSHPSVEIKSFEPPKSQRSVSSQGSTEYDYPVDTIETLPWRSSIETSLSRGSLKIERVTGSMPFLKTRDFNRAILRNSQCWCVDRESKFVLRIGPFKYWRLEFPYQTDEDKKKVDELKEVLSKLLRYEVTPCPFKRGFTVELPEDAKTPKRRRPWKPTERPRSLQPEIYVPVDQMGQQQPETPGSGSPELSDEDTDGDATDDSGITPRAPIQDPLLFRDNTTPSPISIPRSLTAPTQLFHSFQHSDPDEDLPPASPKEPSSLSSSVDSFHSMASFHSPISPDPPSPLYSNHSIPDYHRGHKRDISQLTITNSSLASSLEPQPSSSPTPRPSTPPHLDPSTASSSEDESLSEAITPDPKRSEDPQTTLRRRIRAKQSHRRTLSPLPPSSTLFTPSPKSPTNQLTHAILHRTCTLVLGPPLQFLALLFHIATRIASGDTEVTESPHAGGSGNLWYEAANASRLRQEADYHCDVRGSGIDPDEGWGEDDFGVPIGPRVSSAASKGSVEENQEELGGSWEID